MKYSPFSGTPIPEQEIAEALRTQIEWCKGLGSELNAVVLEILADDFETGGTTARICSGWAEPAVESALALRLTGALNFLVKSGQAPDLAKIYPPTVNIDDRQAFTQTLLSTANNHEHFIRNFLHYVVQTNETRRSLGLFGGFLEISKRTQLPLYLLEIGASAGLNLSWHKFHYDLGAGNTWGDPESPVRLSCNWQGDTPPLEEQPVIQAARGCDIDPIDLHNKDSVTHAEAYIWPDQQDRLDRFRAAVALSAKEGIVVDRQDAADWLAEQLAYRPQQAVTILFHSIMWQYLPTATQVKISRLMEREAARGGAPLAWLKLEPPRTFQPTEVRLNLWQPGNFDHIQLATCDPHCLSVNWRPNSI